MNGAMTGTRRKQKAASNPIGPDRGSGRVFRGGCWSSPAADCRAANRDWRQPSDRNDDLGFRLALVLPSSSQARESGAASGSREGDQAEAERGWCTCVQRQCTNEP